MTTYQHKPIVVEARAVTKQSIEEVAEWCSGRVCREIEMDHDGWSLGSPGIDVPIIGGTARATLGDYVIRGPLGQAVCSYQSFHAAYDVYSTYGTYEDVVA